MWLYDFQTSQFIVHANHYMLRSLCTLDFLQLVNNAAFLTYRLCACQRYERPQSDLSLSVFALDPPIFPVSSNIYQLCLVLSAISGNIWDAPSTGRAWPVWYLGSTQWMGITLKLQGSLHNVWAIVAVHFVIYLFFLWVLLYVWK